MQNLTPQQRQVRAMIRNFLLVATVPELERELAISRHRGDTFRAECVLELIRES